MNRIFWKGFFAGALVSAAIIYSFFRIYWIMEVGMRYFRWHALLWLYLSMALVFIGFSYLLYKTGKLKTARAQKIYFIAFGIFAGLYLAEILLRILGIGTTYMEMREGVFVYPGERTQKTWYMTHRPHETIELKAPEFSFPRTTNSLGLSDKEWTTEKDSNEIRIITLGDSFTEGDGCDSDSSYPRILERLLQAEFPQVRINVMNADRIGSDPWFEYKKLNDLLLKYKPDIVVYTNGSNDLLFDHLYYGGMERFAPDSSVKNKLVRHKWLPLFEMSYVFRVIANAAGYDNTLIGVVDRERNKKTAISDARKLSQDYSRLGVVHHFSCVQVIRVECNEIKQNSYDFNLDELVTGINLPNYSTFSLLDFYRDSLHIDSHNYRNYFWKKDGHHNATGYAAMAKGVFSCIKPLVEQKLKLR